MKRIEERYVLKKKVKSFFSKLLLTIIVFLLGMIFLKKYPNLKETISDEIYEKNFPFQKMKNVYEKYFGNFLSFDKIVKETQPVFQENLSFEKLESYHNGVKVYVMNQYMVPVLESGVIVFIGEKNDFGNTIIVEQVDGVDTAYSNIDIQNKKLYDYVEKGELLGQTKSNYFYLTFQKNGKYLDYKNYF